MAEQYDNLLQYIQHIAGVWRDQSSTDAELLEKFVTRHDQSAFTALVGRHGQLVWFACQGILQNTSDVEDAFQATFLALARQAGTVKEVLPGWLLRVANRISLNSLRTSIRRERRDGEFRRNVLSRKTGQSSSSVDDDSTRAAMEEELRRLPEKIYTVLVLYYQVGHTQARVAELLGRSERTIRSQLLRGIKILRRRLASRGLAVSACTIAGLIGLVPQVAVAASDALIRKTAETACAFVGGKATVPNTVTALADGIKRSTYYKGVVVFVICAVAIGAGLLAANLPNGPAQPPPISALVDGQENTKRLATAPGDDLHPAPAKADIAGRVLDPMGKPLVNAAVAALIRRPFQAGGHGLHDDVVAQGKTDADGRFRLTVSADFPTWYSDRRVTILAHAPGHALVTLQVPLDRPAGEFEMRLAQGESVRGKLLTPNGEPATGVHLRVIRMGDAAFERIEGAEQVAEPVGWPKPVTTNAEGCFEVTGVARKVWVWLMIDDERYAAESLRLMPGESVHTRTLSESWIVEGRVIAGDTGAPLAGARLTVSPTGFSQDYAPLIASSYQDQVTRSRHLDHLDGLTDRDGHFRFRLAMKWAVELQVHAPERTPYLSLNGRLSFDSDPSKSDQMTIALPRGVVAHGQLIEAGSGRAISGGQVCWDAPVHDNPGCVPELIQGFYSLVQADKSGHFAIALPAAAASRLLVYGPGQDFIARRCDQWVLSSPRERGNVWTLEPAPQNALTAYAHAEYRLDLSGTERPEPIRVQLRRGRSIEGELLGPDGQTVKSASMVCAGRVSPIQSLVVLPMTAKEGRFVLPGCEEGHEYTVLFLDLAHDWGGVATVRCLPDSAPPRVQLSPCGEARVRFVNPEGQPVAGFSPNVLVRTPRSVRLDDLPPSPQPCDWQLPTRVDPLWWVTDRTSDDDGVVKLKRLIPGVEYQFGVQTSDATKQIRPPFTVRSAEVRTLPDVIIERGQQKEKIPEEKIVPPAMK